MNGDPREFRILSRYLIGARPSRQLAERYERACSSLFRDGTRSRALNAALRWPVLAGPLDAACGLLAPDDALRQRLLVAAAILETTTEHAERFLPRHRSRAAIAVLVAWHGTRAAANVAVGIACFGLLPLFAGKR